MARAAFLLDKLMSRVGLHGKAFLPLDQQLCVCDSRHHGDADDRKPPRPVCDDNDRAVHELFGTAAGLHADDRGVFCGADGFRIYLARGGVDAGDVRARDRRRDHRRVRIKTHRSQSAAAAVPNGAAALSPAESADGLAEHVHAGMAFLETCGHGDPRDLDHPVGADVFSASARHAVLTSNSMRQLAGRRPANANPNRCRKANSSNTVLRASSAM